MLFLAELYNKANVFLGLIEYELNSLLGASHLVDYMSVHIRFDLERYLLNILKSIQNGSSVTMKTVTSLTTSSENTCLALIIQILYLK